MEGEEEEGAGEKKLVNATIKSAGELHPSTVYGQQRTTITVWPTAASSGGTDPLIPILVDMLRIILEDTRA